MKAETLLDAIREKFVQRLQRKTSWGRNELISEFDQATVNTIATVIELESTYNYSEVLPWDEEQ